MQLHALCAKPWHLIRHKQFGPLVERLASLRKALLWDKCDALGGAVRTFENYAGTLSWAKTKTRRGAAVLLHTRGWDSVQ